MFRQGDVLLVRVAEMPQGRPVRPEHDRLVLARGEATGHHHSVGAGGAELVEGPEGIYLRVAAPTPLEHQEHAPIDLQPGVYRVFRQREYAPQDIDRLVSLLD